MIALWHRLRTGEGQHLDLSQAECIFPLAAHGIVAQAMNGSPPPRHGSRRDDMCPSGAFPCRVETGAEDTWLAVQATNDEEWGALCITIGAPELASLTAAQRRAQEDDIEMRLASWTGERSAGEAMQTLQTAGVPAGIVHAPRELVNDPHLRARGFWQMHERAYMGLSPNPSAPYRVGDAPLPIRTPAPTLGQHNREVLVEIMGLDEDELAGLEERGVIGNVPKIAR